MTTYTEVVEASQDYSSDPGVATGILLMSVGWSYWYPVAPGWPPPPGRAWTTENEAKQWLQAPNFDHPAYAQTVAEWVASQ